MTTPTPDQYGDRAQSEVIGTILLVAIVAIIASVIGIFAIDIYQQAGDNEPAPNVDFDAEQYGEEDRQVRLFHNTGDALDATEISVIVDDGTDRETFEGSNFPSEEIGSQDSVYIGLDNSDDLAVFPAADDPDGPLAVGTEISVIWNSADTDSSATLFEYEVEER